MSSIDPGVYVREKTSRAARSGSSFFMSSIGALGQHQRDPGSELHIDRFLLIPLFGTKSLRNDRFYKGFAQKRRSGIQNFPRRASRAGDIHPRAEPSPVGEAASFFYAIHSSFRIGELSSLDFPDSGRFRLQFFLCHP